jgi:hypothetical protein
MLIECQDPIVAAIEKQQSGVTFHRKATRIGYASVVAELAERLAPTIKDEQRAIAVTIRSGGTGDEQVHGNQPR